jgi:hypothetical protein
VLDLEPVENIVEGKQTDVYITTLVNTSGPLQFFAIEFEG